MNPKAKNRPKICNNKKLNQKEMKLLKYPFENDVNPDNSKMYFFSFVRYIFVETAFRKSVIFEMNQGKHNSTICLMTELIKCALELLFVKILRMRTMRNET